MRNSIGAREITETNDYYPFGMNHLKTGNAYFAQGSYKSYKYNGKELQETGMYSYGWREYMPDTGRWNGIDQLAEDYLSASPYAYVLNNPINMFDPDGRVTMSAWTASMLSETPDGSNSYWYNNGTGFTSYDGGPKGGGGGGSLAYGSTVSYGGMFTMGDGVYTLPPLVLSGYGSSQNWGGAISTYNINHGILYNGISGMQSAWNRANQPNQPFDRMSWVKSDGPVQMIGGMGDPAGIFDIGGQVISNWEPENRYLAMGVGIIGAIALKKPGLAKMGEYEMTSIAVRSALTNRIGKRGFSEVGYQFSKHSGREVNGALWKTAMSAGTKNPAAFNEAGYKIFKEIWRAPGSFKTLNGFIEKRLPDGRGIRFQENWQFKGFLD